MVTTEALTGNSRQGIKPKTPPCIGFDGWLSRNLRPGCGHAYDETPVDLVVYVRNDPVNLVDPEGRDWEMVNGYGFFGANWRGPSQTVTVYAEADESTWFLRFLGSFPICFMKRTWIPVPRAMANKMGALVVEPLHNSILTRTEIGWIVLVRCLVFSMQEAIFSHMRT